MDILDKLLTPFVFIYKAFIFILMLPYHIVMWFVKKIRRNKVNKKNNMKTTISDVKKEDIKVVKGVRSAYSVPNKANIDSVNVKKIDAVKRQKEFEALVKKIRIEEHKKLLEQEKFRIEIQKQDQEKKVKIQAQYQNNKSKQNKKETNSKKEPGKLSKLLTSDIGSKKYNELELEAKKMVLNEQFSDKTKQTARFSSPIIFDYFAKNPKGEYEKSSIEALSRVDVYSFLTEEGYEVYDITAAKSNFLKNAGNYKIKKDKLIFYLSQLSAYLKSGIVLADGVKLLEEQSKKIDEKKVWRAVYYDLSMGDNLSVALEKRRNTFPRLLVNMIKTAEMTGNLIETLDDMVDYYTESESTKKQVKSAMTYPAIVSIFAIVVVVFILVWIVPQFADIYKSFGSDIPAITKFVLSISEFLGNYLIYILLAIVAATITFIYLYKNVVSFKQTVQTFIMKLPVFGNIIIYSEVTIFAKTFANLLNHNVFITDTIEVLSKITDNEIYKKLIHNTTRNLTKGETISKAFKDQWAFPTIAYQMLITGEKTGRLGTMMEKVSEYFQEQHRNIINQMKSLIEPILIVFLAVVVGGILISVIIPMYGMYSEIGG